MIQYKGFKIGGSSIPMFMAGCESLGTIYRNGRTGSMIEVARIEGKIFETMKEAEAHGLELARVGWIENGSRSPRFLIDRFASTWKTNICRCRSRIRRWFSHGQVFGAKQD